MRILPLQSQHQFIRRHIRNKYKIWKGTKHYVIRYWFKDYDEMNEFYNEQWRLGFRHLFCSFNGFSWDEDLANGDSVYVQDLVFIK